MTLDALVAELVAAEVERRIAETRRPELVNQRTVLAVCGMPPRDFMRHCRARDWPSYADRRLRYAKTVDVVAYVETHRFVGRAATGNAYTCNSNDRGKLGANVNVDVAEAATLARGRARRVG